MDEWWPCGVFDVLYESQRRDLPAAEVEVSVEISAKVPGGVGRTVRRIVEENCRTLRFRAHGFEEE